MLIGAGPSFEEHVALVRERQALREAAEDLESEADEMEGLVTWLCINLEDAGTNIQLQVLCAEALRKRQAREIGKTHSKHFEKLLRACIYMINHRTVKLMLLPRG